MADLISYGLLCFGVFAGAFVSGLAGFASLRLRVFRSPRPDARPRPCL